MPSPITRRRLLSMGVGALVLGAGCSNDTGTGGSSDDDPTGSLLGLDLTSADFDGINSCVLTPEQASGPFYLQTDLVRRDITEGRPGSPLRVGLRIEDVIDCRPVEGARVDIWHADLRGDYSAFFDGSSADEDGEGTTFMRGTQLTGVDGIINFTTVFPGWYPGRAIHIHVMVYLELDRVLTTQMYFGDDVIADVYRSAPYRNRGLPDTATTADRIASDPAAQGLEMAVNGDNTGRLALLRLHVPA